MKRRMLAFVLCLSMIACVLPFGVGAEETVSWALEGGTLSITGTGKMRFRTIPWADRLGEIQKLTLDEGITGIQEDAFAGCTALKSVTLSKKLRYIGDRAFAGCTELCWVTLPASLVGIGEEAFSGCTKLTTVDIPASVGRIGDNAFPKTIVCSGLKNSASEDYIKQCGGTFRQVDLHKLASGSGTINGMTWTLSDGTLSVTGEGSLNLGALDSYPWDALRADIVKVRLGTGITRVDRTAFALCRKLTEAMLPESLTKIESGAFSEGVLLSGKAGSEVEAYAKTEGLAFAPVDTALEEQTMEETAAEAAQAASPAEPTQAAETTEAAKATEATKATEAAKATEATKATEAAKATEETKAAEETKAEASTEATEAAEAAGETEATETTEPEAATEVPQPPRPTLTVGDGSGQPGQQVAVTVSLTQNPGLCGLNFTVDYDHTRLELEDYDCADALLTTADWSVGLGEGEKALWLQSDAMTGEGAVLTLLFRVSDTAPLGETAVTLTEITGVDEDAKVVKPACVAGQILVTSGILGDINGDGRVTAADEKRLRRYLSGAAVAIETGNADMNGDGTVDLVDLMLLQKRLGQ